MLDPAESVLGATSERFGMIGFFVASASLLCVYLAVIWSQLAWEWGRESLVMFGWAVATGPAPAFFLFLLWRLRHRIIPLDRHMVYLPLLVWYASFIIIQNWKHKSLSNGFLESATVLGVTGFYLLRFPLTKKAGPRATRRVSLIVAAITCFFAGLVTCVVPSLGE